MRIFLSGASGVVGLRTIGPLLADGHVITASARTQAGCTQLEKLGVRAVLADLFDTAALSRSVAGHDVLINLATHMPSSSWKMLFKSAWQTNARIRSIGVRNLVDAALAGGVQSFVQESFALTYPDRGEQWIDEETALEPAEYAKSVLAAEAEVGRFARAGRAGVVLRFAAFYGPDAMQVRSYINSLKWGWAALPGGPRRFISSVTHDDAASAVVAAVRARSGAYNVVDDVPVRRAEYFAALASSLGVPAPRFMPEWATPLLGAIGGTLARSLRLSNRKLRDETGWKPAFPSVRAGWPAVLGQMKCAPSLKSLLL
jgi:nucleoside-diphosphate-sugar epimerase